MREGREIFDRERAGIVSGEDLPEDKLPDFSSAPARRVLRTPHSAPRVAQLAGKPQFLHTARRDR
jgi:hypothetical protein